MKGRMETMLNFWKGKKEDKKMADKETVTIDKEVWEKTTATLDAVVKKLDVFETNYGTPVAPVPMAPAAPVGPSLADQIATFDGQIDALEDQIDAAISAEKPTKELRKQVNLIMEKKAELRGEARFNSFASQGLGMISQITDTVTAGQMPLIAKIPLVKQEYDRITSNMSPEQRANPASRKAAYDLACGTHMPEIIKVQQEEWQRGVQEGEIHVQLPGQTTPGGVKPPVIPDVKEAFGEAASVALSEVGNRNPDKIANAFGFADTNDMIAFDNEAAEYEKTGKRPSQGGES